MTINEIVSRLNAQKNGNGWIANCPSHEDSTPSLSIAEGKDGKILLKCHAFCDTERVVAAMGLKMSDLMPPKQKKQSKIVATYDYTDASGNPLFQVVRFEPKDFRQRRPDNNAGWIWNMDGVERVLYKLPDVISAVKEEQLICITEGEKDCDALTTFGICATSNPGGATKWQESYTTTLTGANVVIIADKDEPGRKHAQVVAKALYGKATSIVVIELPDRSGNHVKDAYDWIKAGGTFDELSEIVKTATPWEPVKEKKSPPVLPPQHKTTSISDTNKFKIFYNGASKGFLAPDNRGGWVSLSETQIKRLMRSNGVESKTQKNELVSEMDSELLMIQTTQNVDYSGPLAGHYAGMLQIANHRILVTESPTLIEPKEGDWSMYRGIVEGLLGVDQLPFFYGWVKVAYESLRAGVRTPGQALAIAGPRNGGKSLIQNLLTPILGGRCSRPYEYMTAGSPFNAHLFGAEHLMVEDEAPSTDLRARRAFGAQIKSTTVNLEAQCHAKGQTPIMLRPFWRLSITLNDEPENLMVLPPMDESIFDKIILFKSNYQEMPMPTASPGDRQAFWSKLLDELPSFLYYLTNWQIPPEMVSQRFGVTHYHHPEIMNALNELAPEHRLLSLIDGYLFNGLDAEWSGTSEQLERALTDADSKCRSEASRLFSFNTACGTYLGRLAKRFPARFDYQREGPVRRWVISNQ
jgi:5S rRNA maturation endonuclease (ribonuclease M5)